MSSNKLIKTQSEQQTNGEDESTRHLNDIIGVKPTQIEQLPSYSINFRSLRQRYGSIQDQYPLPLKFEQLLQTMKIIEQTYWKKKKPIIYEIKTNAFKILQIGQLLKLDQELYDIKIVEKSVQITPNDVPIENLPAFQPFAQQLAPIFENRIAGVRSKLDRLVQQVHEKYLDVIGESDFNEQSMKFKVYHPTFDLNLVPDIIPQQLPFQIYSEEQRVQLQQIIENTIQYFTKRTVSFMFYPNLVNYLLTKIEMNKEQMEKYIQFLMKVQPDFLQITNQKKEQLKAKWIIQINKSSTVENQIQQLRTYFY
ncbi:unnamed protein product (macronuclear) [Paramecium tetraurelia]|uniref:CDT1 Geminin-binding domain-containing protein n=1 Tax=Paramecium tetraurelia TaxID=5888 RepID=A0BTR6_PARTE|nr:uncharacterized protein GSPATT00032165001 [Paramecium tetraurelia]CAK61933.1 unnamed protein product [Paramecium tetraurelia]|eukprot:XP_001429331.1 hypothetical protein (macronuclear) [Paramecium tetraurelia strain d4-2]